MYLNPLWSLLLLAATAAIYVFVIRPRLQARFVETYVHIDDFWARWWARIVAFRSWLATALAALLIALPDLLAAIAPVDLSPIVGPRWAQTITSLLAVFLAVNTAFKTKPREEK